MSKLGFDKALGRFNKVKQDLPKIIANDAKRFFISGFQREGFTDKAFEPWKPRKNNRTKRDKTRRILVDTGALRRSVSNSVKEANWNAIRFEIELEYAKYINEGTDKMVARKFMGDSLQLRKELKRKMEKVISSIWQG